MAALQQGLTDAAKKIAECAHDCDGDKQFKALRDKAGRLEARRMRFAQLAREAIEPAARAKCARAAWRARIAASHCRALAARGSCGRGVAGGKSELGSEGGRGLGACFGCPLEEADHVGRRRAPRAPPRHGGRGLHGHRDEEGQGPLLAIPRIAGRVGTAGRGATSARPHDAWRGRSRPSTCSAVSSSTWRRRRSSPVFTSAMSAETSPPSGRDQEAYELGLRMLHDGAPPS